MSFENNIIGYTYQLGYRYNDFAQSVQDTDILLTKLVIVLNFLLFIWKGMINSTGISPER